MESFREWLDDNPKLRPLIMFAMVGMLVFMVGVLMALNQKRPDPPLPSQPVPAATGAIPTAGGQEQPGEAPRRPRTAWVREKDTPAMEKPDLQLKPIRVLNQWDEVSHIQEAENWDQIRLSDGKEVWVKSKALVFTKPVNLDKPTDAELTVMAFYQNVARKDYTAAYSYLSSAWKMELSFDQFVDGYARTMSLRTELQRVVPLGPDRFTVDVSMVADEVGHDVKYTGSYTVEKVGDDWQMTSGRLEREAGAEAPPRDVLIPAAPATGEPPAADSTAEPSTPEETATPEPVAPESTPEPTSPPPASETPG